MKFSFIYDLYNLEDNVFSELNLPFNYLDRLDGLQDTISFEFMSSKDLIKTYHKNKKCAFLIKDDNETIIKDLAMCITDISRESTTLYDKNNCPLYTYTVTLSEPNILIDKSIRTDIAITPNAYVSEDGKYPYSSLWDAYVKIMSCHNLNERNEKVYNTFKQINGISDTNINFDVVQANDGYILGDLYFYKNYSSSTTRYTQPDGSINIVTETVSIPELNISNEKLPISRTIECTYSQKGSLTPELDINETFSISLYIYYQNDTIHIEQITTKNNYKYDRWNYEFTYGNDRTLSLYDRLSAIRCPTITYVDMSTYSQLSDVFGRIGAVPYLNFTTQGEDAGKCYVEICDKQGEYSVEEGIKTIDTTSSLDISRTNDNNANSITTQVKNLVCDNTDLIVYPQSITSYLIDRNFPDEPFTIELGKTYGDWQSGVEYFDGGFVQYINQAVPTTYNSQEKKIEGANNYSIQLPSKIDEILHIYKISADNEDSTSITISKIPDDRFVEYSAFKPFPEEIRKYFAYWVRGENTLNQVAALTASKADLDVDYPWDKDDAYKCLRKIKLVIVYKPMVDQTYTWYNYNTLDDKTTEHINLPFKSSSDKQLPSVLSYEMEDKNSDIISFNITTTDVNILKHFAGEKIYFKDNKFIQSGYLGEYDSFEMLVDTYNPIYNTLSTDSWAKVGNEIFVINKNTSMWCKYIGELCVIKSINYEINNKTISASFQISTNIAKSSSLSTYSDNIRVSDNLSTETNVNRQITTYKSFLLNCVANSKYFDYYGINDFPTIPNETNMTFNYCDLPMLGCGIHNFGCFGEIIVGSETYNEIKRDLTYMRYVDFNTISKEDYNEPTKVTYDSNLSMIPGSTTDYLDVSTFDQLYNTINNVSGSFRMAERDDKIVFESAPNPFVIYGGANKEPLVMLAPTETELRSVLTKKYFDYFWTKVDYNWTVSGNEENPKVTFNLEFTYRDTVYSTRKQFNLIGIYTSNSVVYARRGALNNYPTTDEETGEDNILKLITNRNAVWVNSGQIIQANITSCDTSVLGYYANGCSDGMFRNTNPIYLKDSNSNAKLYAVGDTARLGINKFEDLLKDTGFDDLYIDIREKINYCIQYVVLPNNTIEYYTKNNLWSEHINPRLLNRIYHIEEIENNLPWFATHYTPIDGSTNSIIVKKVPKGTTLNDVKRANNEYLVYDTAVGSLITQTNTWGGKRLNAINAVIALENKSFDRDFENNYCILNGNTNEPLFIISADNVAQKDVSDEQISTDLKSIVISAVLQ